jgi:hypothetical protein
MNARHTRVASPAREAAPIQGPERLRAPARALTRSHALRLADEGGGVRFNGETTKMREEFAKLFPDSPEAKKQLKAEAGEKADLSARK